MAEELLRRMAELEARVHAGGAASRRLVELEEDVHRYYSAFLELDAVLGRMAAAQRGLAAGVEAWQVHQAQQARGAREAARAAREAREAEREARAAERAAVPSPLEALLAWFEARLAGLEARGALGARRLAELEDTTDRYYNVFLEVDIVVERVVASQHALVESVLALRAGAAGSSPFRAPGPSGAPAAGSGSSGAPGPSGAPAASGGAGEASGAGAGAAGAGAAGDAPGAVPRQRVAWRGKMCLHGRRGYRCKLCNGSQ
jgi:hypothetical protein